MVEKVETGGMKRFVYSKEGKSNLTAQEKEEIREAYERANQRKKREKFNRRIKWVIGGLVLIILIVSILLFI